MKPINNSLLDARFETGLTLIGAAKRLGMRRSDRLGLYERGVRLPTLKNAVALEILYHQPLAALFPDLYRELRVSIRPKVGKGAYGRHS